MTRTLLPLLAASLFLAGCASGPEASTAGGSAASAPRDEAEAATGSRIPRRAPAPEPGAKKP